MGFYLVERFVPAMDVRDIATAAARLDLADVATARHLWTLLIVGEDTCLSVFEAPGPDSVAACNTAAGFPLDRIVEAVVIGTPR